ncbi:MAG: hypothetical protein ACP5O1_07215 [Phycisphaerae bacterium]
MIYFGPHRRSRLETYEQFRRRLLDETSAFIEWGLKNPHRVPRIPTHPVGLGQFSQRIKTVFWNYVFEQEFGPPGF